MNQTHNPSTTTTGRQQWLTLIAATLGWALDGFDFTLFIFAIPDLNATFDMGAAFTGFILTSTLICSALGGLLFGVLADKYGRAKMLAMTILVYSIASLGSATAQDPIQLLAWRCLLGLGMGGEWATGATLIAETWPPDKKNKALAIMQSGFALGFIASALVSQIVLPLWGWRVLFALGALPALVTFWIRSHVQEPREWLTHKSAKMAEVRKQQVSWFKNFIVSTIFEQLAKLFDPRWRRAFLTGTAMVSCVMFGVWGFFTWLPTFLATPVDAGGAGLSFLKSINWTIALQTGAFFGYLSFGWAADWLGRKKAYAVYVVLTAILAPVYVVMAKSGASLILIGPVIGLFGHGHFSALAPLLSDLFPVEIRATAQSTIYNTGRGISSMAPWLIGSMAQQFGYSIPLLMASIFFILAAILVALLPDPASPIDFTNESVNQLKCQVR